MASTDSQYDSINVSEFTADLHREVLDAIPDALLVIDRHYRVVFANRAFQQMIGARDLGSKTLTCYRVSHGRDEPCDSESHVCPIETVVATRQPDRTVHKHKGPRGEPIWVEIIAAPLFDEAGDVVQIVELCRDITTRMKAEEDSRQRRAELAHLTRLGTMGELTAGLAHELNQPLSAVVNYVHACIECIKAGAATTTQIMDDLEHAAEQAQRAAGILDQVRSFIRKDEPARARTDLNATVREAVELLHFELRQSETRLRLRLDDSLPTVHCVPLQIQQVIVNLMQNALEAMSETDSTRRHLEISTTTAGSDHVELAVSDTGPGLAHDLAECVFEPFRSTKQHGIGMGLAISRSIIEAHDGTLCFDGGGGCGATFRVTLPVTRGDPGHGPRTDGLHHR